MSRVSTDGCSEITCPHHGPENRRKIDELRQQERQEKRDNCPGFQWVGQTFKSCDCCGHPYWEHTHDRQMRDGIGPFAPDPWVLVPITPEQAAACRRKWGGAA